jgi:hypothetical protein
MKSGPDRRGYPFQEIRQHQTDEKNSRKESISSARPNACSRSDASTAQKHVFVGNLNQEFNARVIKGLRDRSGAGFWAIWDPCSWLAFG